MCGQAARPQLWDSRAEGIHPGSEHTRGDGIDGDVASRGVRAHPCGLQKPEVIRANFEQE